MKRRQLLAWAGLAGLASGPAPPAAANDPGPADEAPMPERAERVPRAVTLFLCGDVMTGRGVDQILPRPSAPHLYESYVRSALGYVELAEQANGPIPRPVDFAYVWGDALGELERMQPQARVVNLETSITTSEDAWPGKGIHYRTHPENVGCLTAARIDACVLANNHVLDWGRRGLEETVRVLHAAGIHTAGAGGEGAEAYAPARLPLPGGGRVLVFGYAAASSGVPAGWAAGRHRPGVAFLADLSPDSVERIARGVEAERRPGDLVVASLHWGGNWGYDISRSMRRFAERLVDAAGVDLVHGHSSHHPLGIEVYRGKLVLYGCGDFLNDYEGIGGRRSYRPDLALMYFPTVDPATGSLLGLELVPLQIRRFRLQCAQEADARWLASVLDREGKALGTRVELEPAGTLALRWG